MNRICHPQGTDQIRAEIHSKGSTQALGAREPASGARETGCGERPARLCQDETHVLAEQFGTTEHDRFRGAHLSGNTPKPHSMDRSGRPCSRTCAARPLISERTREAPLALGTVDRAAAHAAHRVRALVVELDDGGPLARLPWWCGRPGSLWAAA